MVNDVVEELRRVHGAHTIILYGSHARGEATAESDLDVAAFAEVSATKRDARIWNGVYLDAFVYPTSVLTSPPDVDMLKLLGGRVLLGDAGALFAALEALDRAGPPAPPEGHEQMLRMWARKMLVRIQRGDVEASYRRHWLLFQLLEDYFTLRGQWYRGPKRALADLQRSEPRVFAAFERALAPDAPFDAIEALVEVVIDSDR
ncbi:MAG TPA: nucleotidyltransferase domain-containing protein [Kofleriaceae bacterium]|nr:nucleotidyltransferase domain-containing protein [Kofleriaceae bacterium]